MLLKDGFSSRANPISMNCLVCVKPESATYGFVISAAT